MTLTTEQVRSCLIAAGIPAWSIVELSDATYKAPLADWLTGDFHRWFFRALKALDIDQYEPEGGDCDDFCDLFCVLARVAHRRTPEGKGHALPIGRINFSKFPGHAVPERHVLVWAMTPDRGLIFPEPQIIGRVESLTVPQLNSVTRCSD